MAPPTNKPPRRWPRRVLLGTGLLLMLAGFLLVVSATAIARWYIGGSDYARFRPTLGGVTLGPAGALTITDLTLFEPDSPAPLLHADRVAIGFSWTQIFSRQIDTVRITGLTVYVRSAGDLPVTLLRLAEPPLPAPSAPPPPPTAEPGLWIANLLATGECVIDPGIPIQTTSARLPLTVLMRMEGSHTSPEPRLDVRLGAAAANSPAAPWLTGQMCYVRGRFLTFALDSHALELRTTDSAWCKLLQPYLPQQPDSARLSLDRLHLDGKIIFATGLASGTVRVLNLSAAALHAGQPAAAAEHLTFSTTFEMPLTTAEAPRVDAASCHIAGTLSLAALSRGDARIDQASTDFKFDQGVLALKSLDLQYARGSITGALAYDGTAKKLAAAALTIAHLDAHEALAAAAPGRVDAQGTFSGTADFSLTAANELTGKIDLTADAPGKLLIADEKIAEAIAQPLAAAKIPQAPPNLNEIVVGQLKNYPWKTAHVEISARQGRPVVRLDLTRQPIKEGEPGYGVDMVMAAQHMKVNYPVQIPGLEISIPNQSIESILGIITGLKALLVGPPLPPTSQPAPR